MEIITRIPRLGEKDVSSYKNKPVLDKFSRVVDIENGVISGNDKSKIIGIIKDAKIIGDDIELLIHLYEHKIRREFLNGQLISISIS
jgi:hypothetical protein